MMGFVKMDLTVLKVSSIISGVNPPLKSGKTSIHWTKASLIGSNSATLAVPFKIRGINYSISSACATSGHCIGNGMELIQFGKQDIVFAGGGEELNWGMSGMFDAMTALSSKYNETPEKASRPYDKTRDGFVIAGGGGVLVLEEYEHAKARGAKIYAEVIGGGMSGDAYHMTAPHPDGLGAKNTMIAAIEDAEINPENIDYVNVHGTSTPLGDVAEVKAIEEVFGEHAYNLNISSTKSMTGHLLGAAGAIEAIACVLSVKEDIVPPTINNTIPDPALDLKLNFTFNKAEKRTVNIALSNTFGFGGHNACVAFKKWE